MNVVIVFSAGLKLPSGAGQTLAEAIECRSDQRQQLDPNRLMTQLAQKQFPPVLPWLLFNDPSRC